MLTHVHPTHPTKENHGMSTPSRTGERGQILVIVAGGMIALLLLAGLVLDGGVALLNRRDGQNTADVASLAGTRLIADHYVDPAIVYTQADIYAGVETSVQANDCTSTGTPCTWTATFVNLSLADVAPVTNAAAAIPSGAVGVKVNVHREPGTFLAGMAGISHWDVDTQAISIANEPTTAPPGQLLPIALKENTGAPYVPGQVYDLTDGKDAPGGFGYLSWDGSNDPNSLADSLCYPDNPEFTMPYSFPGDPGKSNSSGVRACLDKWIGNGQTVLIPIYDVVTGPGNAATYNIVGVAAFVLTSKEQPAVDNIQGYFVEVYPFTSVPGGGGQAPSENSTSYQLSLVQ